MVRVAGTRCFGELVALRISRCGGEELREKTNHHPQADQHDHEHRKHRHRIESRRYARRKVELAQSHPGTDGKNRQRRDHPDARVEKRPHLHGCG
jgi:hypothetical protein